MGFKLKKVALSLVMLYGLLFVNFLPALSAVRTWDAGDVFVWGFGNRIFIKITDAVENLAEITDLNEQYEIKLNITSVDSINEEYDAYRTTTDGLTFLNDRDYSWNEFASDYLIPSSFYSASFVWDYEHNTTVCTEFEIGLDFWYLIEPDWASLNNAFVDLFDEELILDTVTNPFNSTIHDITLGDILAANEFAFMNESDLTAAITKFTATTSEWTFEIDLSNYLMEPMWNGSMNIYYPYDFYLQKVSLNFTDGGVLNNCHYKNKFLITIDEIETYVDIELTYILGGIDELPDYIEEPIIITPPDITTINQTITVTTGIYIGTFVIIVATGFSIATIILRRKRK